MTLRLLLTHFGPRPDQNPAAQQPVSIGECYSIDDASRVIIQLEAAR